MEFNTWNEETTHYVYNETRCFGDGIHLGFVATSIMIMLAYAFEICRDPLATELREKIKKLEQENDELHETIEAMHDELDERQEKINRFDETISNLRDVLKIQRDLEALD